MEGSFQLRTPALIDFFCGTHFFVTMLHARFGNESLVVSR